MSCAGPMVGAVGEEVSGERNTPRNRPKRQVRNHREVQGQVRVDPTLAHPQASTLEVGLVVTQATASEARSPSWSLSTFPGLCVTLGRLCPSQALTSQNLWKGLPGRPHLQGLGREQIGSWASVPHP